jgi:membrane-associated phospholipid phosphatase
MEMIKFLQTFSSPFLDKFFELITMLGEESIYIIFLGVIFWCFDKKLGYKLAFIFLFSSVANSIVKNLFKSPRPIGVEGIRSLRVETATGYSFPSGHTQATSVFWSSMILRYKKAVFYFVGPLTVLLVGISRMYLGVHWPKDVFMGIILGIICAIVGSILFDYSQKVNSKLILLIVVIPALIGLLFFSTNEDYIKSTAVLFSFYLGYILEDRYIGFTVKSPVDKQIYKFLIGIIGILVIKVLMKPLLPHNSLGVFIRYFMTGIWTTICAPLVFGALKISSINKNNKYMSV